MRVRFVNLRLVSGTHSCNSRVGLPERQAQPQDTKNRNYDCQYCEVVHETAIRVHVSELVRSREVSKRSSSSEVSGKIGSEPSANHE